MPNLTVALLVTLALVVIATVSGVALRAHQTKIRQYQHRPGAIAPVDPSFLAPYGEEPIGYGTRATLVQFSTEFCSRCPATARVLETEAGMRDGVHHVEIDVTTRQELIEHFNVLRTPTVLLLDAAGHVVSRASGPISVAQARSLLATV